MSEVLGFIAYVDTAYEEMDLRQDGTLYKFVLTRISGKPKDCNYSQEFRVGKNLKRTS
jgi:hypothetical protein